MLLGRPTDYPQQYDPSVLFRIDRADNRLNHQIDAMLFAGIDVWHAYEFSCLTTKGLPVSAVLKIVYPSSSQFLVESKSLKLYLNSFNMSHIGDNPADALQQSVSIITNDLYALLGCQVSVRWFRELTKPCFDFNDYQVLESAVDVDSFSTAVYEESPDLLTMRNGNETEMKCCSHLLRSNCKVTRQPDWGSLFIHLQGKRHPDGASLLKYIISLRNELHFHEEICELVYKRLWDTYTPEKLAVTCLYTRRGGIDICPSRASHPYMLPRHLITPDVLTEKLLRQ